MSTLADVIAWTGKDVLAHLDRQADVPVVSAQACQGDVSILRVTTAPAADPMPAGVLVLPAVASPNEHTLHPHGPCFWAPHEPTAPGDVMLGTLTVPEGSEAYLSHQEHGALIIAPGTYRVGRQRELRAEWAAVAD